MYLREAQSNVPVASLHLNNSQVGYIAPGCGWKPRGWLRVAVVIPLYNKAPYIERALRSVLAQTRPPDEIIVVDDGSTDGGAELVRTMNIPGIKLVSQANSGVSAARNRGVIETDSDMVAFLDADDEWYPEFLHRTIEVASRFPHAVAVFTNFVDSQTGVPCLFDVPNAPGIVDDYFELARRNRGQGMFTSATLIKRDVLIKVGGFPEGVSFGEDWDTWARLAWSGPVAVVPDVLAIYHTEVLDSLSRPVLKESPSRLAVPPVVRTYQRWKREGLIPSVLNRSSRHWINLVVAVHAWSLVKAGRQAQARWELTRYGGIAGAGTIWLKAAVGSCLPHGWVRSAARFCRAVRLGVGLTRTNQRGKIVGPGGNARTETRPRRCHRDQLPGNE